MMRDYGLEREAKKRLAERYTAPELADLLDVNIEYLIDEFWDAILERPDILAEIGYGEEDE